MSAFEGRPCERDGTRSVEDNGDFVPRPNYHHAKKQRELAKKARQLEKQQRRKSRGNATEEVAPPTDAPGDLSAPTPAPEA